MGSSYQKIVAKDNNIPDSIRKIPFVWYYGNRSNNKFAGTNFSDSFGGTTGAKAPGMPNGSLVSICNGDPSRLLLLLALPDGPRCRRDQSVRVSLRRRPVRRHRPNRGAAKALVPQLVVRHHHLRDRGGRELLGVRASHPRLVVGLRHSDRLHRHLDPPLLLRRAAVQEPGHIRRPPHARHAGSRLRSSQLEGDSPD